MKVFLDSVGCRLNQSEIERYGRHFRCLGHEIVVRPEEADLAVVNTCTVTARAASDSRQKARQLERAGIEQIILTGCWSTLNPAEAAELPGVIRTIDNREKDGLVGKILHVPEATFDQEMPARFPLPGARKRTRAFIKVQDGCENHCSFCVTTIARGKGRSYPVDRVLKEIEIALDGGVHEIVISGVHLGSWGVDLNTPSNLRTLIKTILNNTKTPRLRLSSVEPWALDADFFSLWEDRRLCRHLHLPLQSGAASTLERMSRNKTPEAFLDLVTLARDSVPEIAITTDMIVGFPGESEAEFAESIEFVDRIQFAGGHVFTYSERPGTRASFLPEPVPNQIRKLRNKHMRQVLEESKRRYYDRFRHRRMNVLWESATPLESDLCQMNGLTDNYLRVNAVSKRDLSNRFSWTRMKSVDHGCMLGTILDSG
jgi:threonylcarbamoyladenosine tRNA methylthiotransferase MtaB